VSIRTHFSTREPMHTGITFWSCRCRARGLQAAKNFFLSLGFDLRSFLISRPRSKTVDLPVPNSLVRLCFLRLCFAPAGSVLTGVMVRFIPRGPACSSPQCVRPNPKLQIFLRATGLTSCYRSRPCVVSLLSDSIAPSSCMVGEYVGSLISTASVGSCCDLGSCR
jgi:hypothetical protein